MTTLDVSIPLAVLKNLICVTSSKQCIIPSITIEEAMGILLINFKSTYGMCTPVSKHQLELNRNNSTWHNRCFMHLFLFTRVVKRDALVHTTRVCVCLLVCYALISTNLMIIMLIVHGRKVKSWVKYDHSLLDVFYQWLCLHMKIFNLLPKFNTYINQTPSFVHFSHASHIMQRVHSIFFLAFVLVVVGLHYFQRCRI